MGDISESLKVSSCVGNASLYSRYSSSFFWTAVRELPDCLDSSQGRVRLRRTTIVLKTCRIIENGAAHAQH